MHRLKTVACIGQSPGDDDRHGIVQEGVFHLLLDLDWLDRSQNRFDLVEFPCVAGRTVHHQMSRKRTSCALVWMNRLRLSTSSPMSSENAESAIPVSSTETCRRLRRAGSMVVSQSSS